MAKKRTPKLKSFKIENPLYSYVVFIRVGGSRDAAIAWTEKKFKGKVWPLNSVLSRDNATCFFLEGEPSHVIWFSAEPRASMIAHEAFHSSYHVLKTAGMGALDEGNEEAYAYLIQWTVSEITKRVWD